ncbi:MAG TPA: exodeoxyribonuclease III, partial [Alphaproteobacteria bacterium]|nr:exodeoxyribonuclease III [Alphaproteobacteria bacterium]
DVWSHRQLLKVVSHTPIEVEHMARWYDSHDWVDAVRRFVPEDEKLYSWWSYRSPDWAKADQGRRLDHIWVTPALADGLRTASVYKVARGYEKASDHAPVVAELEV